MKDKEFENYLITYENSLKVINYKLERSQREIDEYERILNVFNKSGVIKNTTTLVGTLLSFLIVLISKFGIAGTILGNFKLILAFVSSYLLTNMAGALFEKVYVSKKLGITLDELKEYVNSNYGIYLNNLNIVSRENAKKEELLREKNHMVRYYNEKIIEKTNSNVVENNVNNKKIEKILIRL